jgi:hypothetical protein
MKRYMGFSADTKPEDAVAKFVELYGVPPAETKLHGCLLVGPLPEEKEKE